MGLLLIIGVLSLLFLAVLSYNHSASSSIIVINTARAFVQPDSTSPKDVVKDANYRSFNTSFSTPISRFTTPINISHNKGASEDPWISISSNNVFVVWDDNSTGNADILLSKSTDGGNTFSKPVNLSNNTGRSVNPVISVSGNDVFVVWDDTTFGNYEIFMIRSIDGGNYFSKPVNLSNNRGESAYPYIHASGSNVYVVWHDNSTTSNFGIYYIKSNDGGNTFSKPVNLTKNTMTDSGFPSILSSANNKYVYVIWQENSTTNGNSFEISLRRSNDGGNTFSKPIVLSNNTGSSEDPSMAISGNASLFVTWDDDTMGNYEIYYVKSSNSGNTFSKPVNLSNDLGQSIYPQVATSGNNTYIIWADDTPGNDEIYYVKSSDGGNTFSKPLRLTQSSGDSLGPQIAISGDSIYFVWHDSTLGNYEVLFSKLVK